MRVRYWITLRLCKSGSTSRTRGRKSAGNRTESPSLEKRRGRLAPPDPCYGLACALRQYANPARPYDRLAGVRIVEDQAARDQIGSARRLQSGQSVDVDEYGFGARIHGEWSTRRVAHQGVVLHLVVALIAAGDVHAVGYQRSDHALPSQGHHVGSERVALIGAAYEDALAHH